MRILPVIKFYYGTQLLVFRNMGKHELPNEIVMMILEQIQEDIFDVDEFYDCFAHAVLPSHTKTKSELIEFLDNMYPKILEEYYIHKLVAPAYDKMICGIM